LATLSLGGCVAQMQQLSAGQVGCPPDEVQVSDDQMHFNSRTWQASCRGKSFFCTSAGGGQYSSPQTSCAELRPPVAGAPAAAPTAPGAAASTPPAAAASATGK
jgi:hypothetical protein